MGSRKDKILAQINPWRVVDFSSDIFLAQSCFGKSLIYCVRSFCNIPYADWVYFVKFSLEKNSKTPMLNNYMLTRNNFLEFLIQEKNNSLFLYRQLLQSGAPLLGLAKSIYMN